LNILSKNFSVDYDVSFYIVESDSSDETIDMLQKIRLMMPNFEYQSLGNLRESIPDRVERISYCRNAYVQYIRVNESKYLWDLIAVADLDGINNGINVNSVRSLRENGYDWDVITCNQNAPYYDIYALRSKGWVEFDCLKVVREAERDIEKKLGSVDQKNPYIHLRSRWERNQLRKRYIYKNMRYIPSWTQPFEVDSAFGGIAIYKTNNFLNFDYSLDEGDSAECEHVTFHRKIRLNGGKIMIYPSFINGGWNEHSLNKLWLIRILRRCKSMAKNAFSSIQLNG